MALVDPRCFAFDPIEVFEAMAALASRVVCAPLIYGYVSYAVEGFRPRRILFADIPAIGRDRPVQRLGRVDSGLLREHCAARSSLCDTP